MTDPERDPDRLLDEGGLGADLLRSAKGDAPGSASREQTAIRLGLVAAGTGELAKAGGGLALVAKLGGVLLAVAVGAGVIVSREEKKSEPATPPRASAEIVRPSESVTPKEEVSAALSARPTATPRPTTVPLIKPSDEEQALIAEARGAVLRSDQVSANAALDRYAREYPRGALTMEAGVLRVEALVRWGEPEKASRLAKELIAKEPQAPQAERLRELLRVLGP